MTAGAPAHSADVASLFPAGVVAVELHGEADAAALSAEELCIARGFSGKRIADFAAGRTCARRALRELGHDDVSLSIASDRRPAWPDGIVGSISHTRGFCAVAVARSVDYRSIGLDVEIAGRVVGEVWESVFTPAELVFLSALVERERDTVATIVFSAKEAFYKCQFGITAGWLDFVDVTVSVYASDERSGTVRFECVQEKRHPAMPSVGRYVISGELVLTGTVVPEKRAFVETL